MRRDRSGISAGDVFALIHHGLVRTRVNRAGGVVLAASIGASKSMLGVCDLAGEVLAETGLDLDVTLGPDTVLRTVADRLERLRDKVVPADRPVRGVGVCLPGPVDVATGTVVESPLLPASTIDVDRKLPWLTSCR